MIDVKKLITGFLILATAAVSSDLIISLVVNASPAPAAPTSQITLSDNQTSSSAFNAYFPEEETDEVTVASATTTVTTSSDNDDPNNLTDALADSFVNQVAAANPDGLSEDEGNDAPTIIAPDTTQIASQLAEATATQNLQIPDWDVEAESQPVVVESTSSPAAIQQYATALMSVLGNHFNSQVESILSDPDSADTDDLAYVESQAQSALGDTLALKTPQPIVGFQKSLVVNLVYDKNLLQLVTLAQTDPVKAGLIFQEEDANFETAQQQLQTQAQLLANSAALNQTTGGSQNPSTPNALVALLDSTLGIPTAHAQWTVFDPATWTLISTNQIQNIEQQLEKELKNTLLQILKNTLVALIQRKVLAYVQGSGVPRFIQNWGTTLIGAYQQTAINAINSQISCGTFSAFEPQIKLTLGAYYKPGSNICANQFAASLGSNSLQQFYNNFKNGGFVAFGASTLPSGNPYGGIFFNAQIVDYTAQNAKQATLAKATASGGVNGDSACDDQSNPNNGEHTVCENPDGPDYTLNGSGESCGPGDTPVIYANQGVCSDGTEPQVTTPGTFTAFTVQSATDATPKQIAAANSIVGLLNAVLGSLLNGLASAAVNAVGKAVNNGLQGGISSINPATITGGGTAPSSTPLMCNPANQTITLIASSTYPLSFAASGGTTDANGNFPTYNWASSDGASSTGSIFNDTYTSAGSYTVTLTDSAGDAPSTCQTTVQ